MCGIIGAINSKIQEDKFISARDVLFERGPDDAGYFFDEKNDVKLGHRRLSIIDLSKAGHQPMISSDGRFVIIFNGEIYNYIEIRRELKDFYKFKTKTDTEVLLASFIKWEERCLDKLNGMFSFAIWDKRDKKLFCARDRLGIKPFFYYSDNEFFLFSSEIKALLKLGLKAKVNDQAIFNYLNSGYYDHCENTFFEGINKLEAGHYLIFSNNKLKIKRYWYLPDKVKDYSNIPKEQIENNFLELLKDSISLRFRSDVPVGVNLSIGLDSNSLLYYSREITKKNLPTFTMGVDSDEYDERLLIEKTLSKEQKEVWHTCSLSSKEVPLLAENMNLIQDQPYGGVPTILYDKLIKLAKKSGVIVLLEGQGGDELLAGYKYYRLEHLIDLWRQKEYNRAKDFIQKSELQVDLKSLEKLAKQKTQTLLDYSQDLTKETDSSIINSEFKEIFVGKNNYKFEKPFNSNLQNAQYRDLIYTKLPRVLRFNDHVTMAYGRELRVPYLDYRLVEFCFSLPVEYKLNSRHQKVLLRDTMGQFLPQIIKNKPKKAFGAVQTIWLKNDLKDWAISIINSSSFRGRGYWDLKVLDKKINDFYYNRGDNSFFIWQCINLELWFKKFIDK